MIKNEDEDNLNKKKKKEKNKSLFICRHDKMDHDNIMINNQTSRPTNMSQSINIRFYLRFN